MQQQDTALQDYTNLAIEARDNGVHIVTLNRPSKRNALDAATIEELISFFSNVSSVIRMIS